MSISSIYNNNYVNFKTNFITQTVDLNNSSYILKNTICQTSSSISLSENQSMKITNFPELEEELVRLQSEVKTLESKVRTLENRKMMKVTKVILNLT